MRTFRASAACKQHFRQHGRSELYDDARDRQEGSIAEVRSVAYMEPASRSKQEIGAKKCDQRSVTDYYFATSPTRPSAWRAQHLCHLAAEAGFGILSGNQ